MKKNLQKILGAVLLLFILAGCTTSVTVSYMKPSRINMGPYRNIAVASTRDRSGFAEPPFFIRAADKASSEKYGKRFSSFSSQLPHSVAWDATENLMDMLRGTSFFDIMTPEQTDRILESDPWTVSRREMFMRKGIDAVMIPKIEGMNANEWISSESREVTVAKEDGTKETRTETRYFYNWEISVRWSVTVIDAETEDVIVRDSFDAKSADQVEIADDSFITPNFRNEFGMLIGNMIREFRRDIVPEKTSVSMSLMKDKSEIPAAVEAYGLLKDGRYLTALDMLTGVWKEYGSIPAGYNAALLLGGLGDFEKAVDLADEVMKAGGGSDAVHLRSQLLEAWKNNDLTEEMLRKDKPSGGSGLDIYDTIGI